MPDLFYLQDSRGSGTVGNDLLFWCATGGYTTNVEKALILTREEAISHHQSRESDIPWPKDYIDQRLRKVCDIQNCKRSEALEISGITLIKKQRPKATVERCDGCGRFLREDERYLYDCENCGTDNRP
jgi:hypothetical protein